MMVMLTRVGDERMSGTVAALDLAPFKSEFAAANSATADLRLAKGGPQRRRRTGASCSCRPFARVGLGPVARALGAAGTLVACVLLAIGCATTRQGFGSSGAATAETQEVRTVKVAGIVLKWIKADKEQNFRRAEPLIREAAAAGAQIVVTTECFLDGYAIRDRAIPADAWLQMAEQVPNGRYVQRLSGLADELNIHLVAGLVERLGEKTFNTAILVGPDGRLLGKYHKQSLGHELPRNTPGDESPVFDTPYGKVGLIICADRREPEMVRRIASRGPVLIICPSGGMWGPKDNDYHLQDRSRENGVPIVFVHPCEFLVTGPDGEILDRRFVGQEMDVIGAEIGGAADPHLVAIYDLPLAAR